ncbi:MAG TPA: hypothetical protein VF168_03215 [Trueperaceae bacterium]
MKRGGGFTLLEVVIAGGLLAVGVLSVTMLQAQALRAQRGVAVVRRLVAVTEAELYRALSLPEPSGGECAGSAAAQLTSCSIETESCRLSSDPVCYASRSARATLVSVEAEDEGRSFALSAVHVRFGR